MGNRRRFLIQSSLTAGAVAFCKPLQSIAGITNNNILGNIFNTVPVFHTGNLYGSLSPFAAGKKAGLGGLRNISLALKEKSASHILLDAGNFLKEISSLQDDRNMIACMNKTGYHAVNIGNSEVLKGQDHLVSLVQDVNFKLINCNYQFSDPVLKNKVSPYHVIKYGQFKIGITGVGRKIKNVNGITFYHPYKKANETAAYLKQQLNCDLVVCLSDLNFKEKNKQPDNYKLAEASENIDIIVGRLTDTIHTQFILRNKIKHEVIVSNSGSEGLTLANVSFTFNGSHTKQQLTCKNYIPGAGDGHSFEAHRKLIA